MRRAHIGQSRMLAVTGPEQRDQRHSHDRKLWRNPKSIARRYTSVSVPRYSAQEVCRR